MVITISDYKVVKSANSSFDSRVLNSRACLYGPAPTSAPTESGREPIVKFVNAGKDAKDVVPFETPFMNASAVVLVYAIANLFSPAVQFEVVTLITPSEGFPVFLIKTIKFPLDG